MAMNNLIRALAVILLIFTPLISSILVIALTKPDPEIGGLIQIFALLGGILGTVLTAVVGLIASLFVKREDKSVAIAPYLVCSTLFSVIAILYSISASS